MSATPNLRFEFIYTYEDMRAAANVLAGSPGKRSSRSMAIWIVILAMSITIFVVYHQAKISSPPPVVPRIPAPANHLLAVVLNLAPYAIIILLSWFLFFRHVIGARKAWVKRDKKNPVTLTLLPTGVFWETPDGRSEIAWTHYERFGESQTLFVLCVDKSECTPIPKRAMTPEQILQVRAILSANVGKPKGFEVLPPKAESRT